MATAWIHPEAFDALPGVCAKTGVATEVRIPVTVEYVPRPFRWLQLASVYAFLFGRTAEHRRRRVRLPISATAWHRYRRRQLAAIAAFVIGAGGALAGSLSVHPIVELCGYVLAGAAFAAGMRSHHRNWIGLTVDRKGRLVTIERCHPAFARGAGEVARRHAPPARPARRLRAR
jgi:hypothetical protein